MTLPTLRPNSRWRATTRRCINCSASRLLRRLLRNTELDRRCRVMRWSCSMQLSGFCTCEPGGSRRAAACWGFLNEQLSQQAASASLRATQHMRWCCSSSQPSRAVHIMSRRASSAPGVDDCNGGRPGSAMNRTTLRSTCQRQRRNAASPRRLSLPLARGSTSCPRCCSTSCGSRRRVRRGTSRRAAAEIVGPATNSLQRAKAR